MQIKAFMLCLIWMVGIVAVTSLPNNLNHYLNYSHNNDTGALHYERYCWEMGPTEVKDESYLSLSVGALVMVTGPSDLCSGFSLSPAWQIYHRSQWDEMTVESCLALPIVIQGLDDGIWPVR